MKRILILLSIVVVALAYAGCKQGCDGQMCLNSGVCKDGECECVGRYSGENCDTFCPIGYEGASCNIQQRSKFIRQWSTQTRSSAGANINHALVVSPGPTISTVYIANVASQGFTVVGTVTGPKTMDIYEQNATGNYTGKVSGSGYIDGQKLAINLRIENGVNYFMTCNP